MLRPVKSLLRRLIVGALSVSPPLGRLILRSYLRAGLPLPKSVEWIVAELKVKLIPTPSETAVRLTDGVTMRIDLETSVGRTIYYHGASEPLLLKLLSSVLASGNVVIDAGANIGEITLYAASLVGKAGKVYAIEASPVALADLTNNIRLNRFQNIEVIEVAVGDQDGTATFQLGRGRASGSSSLYEPHDFTGQVVSVPMMRLDTLVAQRQIPLVHCLKMDVEGAELATLRGAQSLLRSRTAPLIIFEFNEQVAARAKWDLGDVERFLTGFGYEMFLIGKGSLLPVAAMMASLQPGSGSLKVDLLAVPPGDNKLLAAHLRF